MKKITCFMTAILLLCSIVFVMPASAVEPRISNQIATCNITSTARQGTIKIVFVINGSGIMDKIGCESINIYAKSGSNWVLVKNLTENNTGMSRTNTHAYTNTILYNSTAGVEYKVVVTVFAENSTGRDTRTKTFSLIGK